MLGHYHMTSFREPRTHGPQPCATGPSKDTGSDGKEKKSLRLSWEPQRGHATTHRYPVQRPCPCTDSRSQGHTGPGLSAGPRGEELPQVFHLHKPHQRALPQPCPRMEKQVDIRRAISHGAIQPGAHLRVNYLSFQAVPSSDTRGTALKETRAWRVSGKGGGAGSQEVEGESPC